MNFHLVGRTGQGKAVIAARIHHDRPVIDRIAVADPVAGNQRRVAAVKRHLIRFGKRQRVVVGVVLIREEDAFIRKREAVIGVAALLRIRRLHRDVIIPAVEQQPGEFFGLVRLHRKRLDRFQRTIALIHPDGHLRRIGRSERECVFPVPDGNHRIVIDRIAVTDPPLGNRV